MSTLPRAHPTPRPRGLSHVPAPKHRPHAAVSSSKAYELPSTRRTSISADRLPLSSVAVPSPVPAGGSSTFSSLARSRHLPEAGCTSAGHHVPPVRSAAPPPLRRRRRPRRCSCRRVVDVLRHDRVHGRWELVCDGSDVAGRAAAWQDVRPSASRFTVACWMVRSPAGRSGSTPTRSE